jgi:S1-C subfamily serine protease
MEYFIRASRLAHDTALAGMPYPNQGLRLNNQCLVEVLWANSPANQAGLKLGDMVWSLEKDALLQPERKNLEAALQALTSGPHTLYIVSPADRDKGLVQMNQDHTNYFNPKRHKLSLQL